jgi:3-oxoacyl-[acyl-carrier-protein] synthase II
VTGGVWITGMGAVTPGGWSAAETWDTVVNGRSCGKELKRFPTFEAATKVAAPVPGREVSVSEHVPLSLEFGQAAVREAMDQAGLDPAEGQVDVVALASHGERRLPGQERDPLLGAISDLAATLAADVGASRSTALYGACAGGVLAVGTAFKLLRSGTVSAVVAGGADSLLREIDFFSFCSLYAMSTRDCPPEEASCPFDSRRDGFVLGEGAAFLVLEREDAARRRGAEPLAVVHGFGSAQNAYHMVASPPDALGPTHAMARAMADARVAPDDIGYINAHGTSTRDNDWCESLAVRKAFGAVADRVPMSSAKSVLGHSMGAAGAMETILCVQTLAEGVLPPTINLEAPDPRCDLDYVPTTAREVPVDYVVNNGFGFGGHSSALVIGRRP